MKKKKEKDRSIHTRKKWKRERMVEWKGGSRRRKDQLYILRYNIFKFQKIRMPEWPSGVKVLHQKRVFYYTKLYDSCKEMIIRVRVVHCGLFLLLFIYVIFNCFKFIFVSFKNKFNWHQYIHKSFYILIFIYNIYCNYI